MLTQELVRELLDCYDPKTGVLTWRERDDRAWNARFAGTRAGRSNRGYIEVRIFHKRYAAHRLIWLWMTGSFPEHCIDHINHDGSDNRWTNLRAATLGDNQQNKSMQSNNTSGAVGVYWNKKAAKWLAQIQVGGHNNYLGLFTEKHEAIAARKAAEVEYGFHPNHGMAA